MNDDIDLLPDDDDDDLLNLDGHDDSDAQQKEIEIDFKSKEYSEMCSKAEDFFESTGLPVVYSGREVEMMNLYRSLSPDRQQMSDQYSKQIFNLTNIQHFTYIDHNKVDVVKRDKSNPFDRPKTTIITNSDNQNKIDNPISESFFFNDKFRNFKFNTLSDEVTSTFDDPYIYICFVHSGNPITKVIKAITSDPFSHVSISFDKNLRTMNSFTNSSKGQTGHLVEGLVWENPLTEFNSSTTFELYRMKIGTEGKKAVLEYVRDIHRKGSNYNDLGLIVNVILRRDAKAKLKTDPHSLFCSQYIALALQKAGIEFDKKPEFMRPYDFLKLSSKRDIKFVEEGNLYQYFINNNAELMPGDFHYVPPQEGFIAKVTKFMPKVTVKISIEKES